MLVRSFATRFANKLGKNIETIPQNVMKAFQAYPWPGNVRELENVIERAVILAQDDTLRMEESFELRDVPLRGSSGKATLEEGTRPHPWYPCADRIGDLRPARCSPDPRCESQHAALPHAKAWDQTLELIHVITRSHGIS